METTIVRLYRVWSLGFRCLGYLRVWLGGEGSEFRV